MALKQSYGGHHTKFLFRSLVQAKTRTLRKDKDIRHFEDVSSWQIWRLWRKFEQYCKRWRIWIILWCKQIGKSKVSYWNYERFDLENMMMKDGMSFAFFSAFLRPETPAQVFTWELCEIFNNTFSQNTSTRLLQ